MRREVDLQEISDGKLYDANDLVKADCNDCDGCFECCTGMGESIILDPLDVFRLTAELGKSFEQLLADCVELHVKDGMILPNLKMTGGRDCCAFLGAEGRCSIHPFRPGICRLFPLGRIYENDSFRYFLQTGECRKENRSKVKVKKWIDMPDFKRYEHFISEWHFFIKELQERLMQQPDMEAAKRINLCVLELFSFKAWEQDGDFYAQFADRLQEAQKFMK